MPELHLFIIWEAAQALRSKILNDIKNNFTIISIKNIKWDSDNFSQNLTRFYGENLPNGSHKEIEVGKGRFSLIVVIDQNPIYEQRLTSKGSSRVNVNTFDAKARYREWTGGGHKIHATNNPIESRHDLFLLLGSTVEQHLRETENPPAREENIDRNITGCVQWNSLGELLTALNETTKYVVLRNHEGFPHTHNDETHGDIDLLVESKNNIASLLNAKPVYRSSSRSHYKINVGNKTIRFDIRFVGDGYYDENWQKSILDNRIYKDGFYIPSDDDARYSLLYHALIHKPKISEDYAAVLKKAGIEERFSKESLREYMQQKLYKYTIPIDHSVYFNVKNCSHPFKKYSIRRDIYWKTHQVKRKALGHLNEDSLRRIRKIKSKIKSKIKKL